MLRRIALALAVAVITAAALVGVQNAVIAAYFPRLERMTTDFSPAYLQRELQRLAAQPPQAIFLGDSVVWGYQLPASRTAVADLRARGCTCVNLAFKSASPPNYYTVAQLLDASAVKPKAVVLEINQKVFSEGDPAYRKLHPALAELGAPVLTPQERAELVLPPQDAATERLDRALAPLWLLYAMRSDIRETLYGEPDNGPAPPPTAALFQASYDLTPLGPRNTGVRFLVKTVDAMKRRGIAVIAFMTPTNHALLHEFIDNADYRSNGAFLQRLLRAHGARVLDLDDAFPPSMFIDNDHLTAAGQRRLASELAPLLPQ